jgi:two-component system, NtrC family, sensor kinase
MLPTKNLNASASPSSLSTAPASMARKWDGSAKSEALLESLQTQLEHAQRMATLGELASTTTHEFNNLLMTILNYAKLGLRHKDEGTRDKALQRIYDAANKAGRLTSGVLALARNRSGLMEPTDLRQVIEDAILLVEREFKKNRIQLETQLMEVSPVLGVGNELQRMVINFLINAKQATPEGGTVLIQLADSDDREMVILTIRDNGSGISPAVLPKIFDPYFTTKAGPDASGRGGTGIGLSACKEIIDTHKGRIRVDSTPGKGTAFTIRLPRVAS